MAFRSLPDTFSPDRRTIRGRLCLAVLLALLAAVPAYAAEIRLESAREIFAMDPYAAVAKYGTPALGFGGMIVYRSTFADLPTDVTLFFVDGQLDELTLSFGVDAKSEEQLRSEADRVVKRLGFVFGKPEYSLRDGGEYRTYLWGSGDGMLVHCVVFAGEARRHTIRVQRGGR